MSAIHANLDALILRADFDVSDDEQRIVSKTEKIKINDLQKDSFFYSALRKPDFQRETCEWSPDRIAGLIRSFILDEMIPAVILWENKGLNFVIDGSHRLSALIAWVQNDYGDGATSQSFFNHDIPDEQVSVAKRTKSLIEKEFGTYESHRDAILNPSNYGPDVLERARRFSRLNIYVQWVEGNVKAAEDSFLRINQRSAMIDKEEMEFIKTRTMPKTIAARAIIRKGTGHPYWGGFSQPVQDDVRRLASSIHTLLFSPSLTDPIAEGPLAPGGSAHAGPALKMVSDFVQLCVGTIVREPDTSGRRTVEYLARSERVMQLILSKKDHSLGLHPAVYFYSWSGNQQPVVFLAWAAILVDFERRKKLDSFVKSRAVLEQFLVENRILVSQVVRKFGSNLSGETKLREFYLSILSRIEAGDTSDGIVMSLLIDPAYSYLQPKELPEQPASGKKLSSRVKSGVVLRGIIQNSHRCGICQGLVPPQAFSFDHIQPRRDGGLSVATNTQITHPYCNTGFKEKLGSIPG